MKKVINLIWLWLIFTFIWTYIWIENSININLFIYIILTFSIILSMWFWWKIKWLNYLIFFIFNFIVWIGFVPQINNLLNNNLDYYIYNALIWTILILLIFWTIWYRSKSVNLKFYNYLIYALFWVIILWLANLFLGYSVLSIIISSFVLIICSIFVYYDINMIKNNMYENEVFWAMSMYLNIINIFQSLLSLIWLSSND